MTALRTAAALFAKAAAHAVDAPAEGDAPAEDGRAVQVEAAAAGEAPRPAAYVSPSVLVREFGRRFGLPSPARPANPGTRLAESRQQLLEQAVEHLRRVTDPWDYPTGTAPAVDVAAVASGLCDVVLTAYGTAAVYGIELDPVIAEVHRADLTQRHADAHGHARQGSQYSAPDVAAVLAGQHNGTDPADRTWWARQVLDAMTDGRESPGALEGLEVMADGWLDEPNDDLSGWVPWALVVSGHGHLLWRHLADLRDARDARDDEL